MTKLLDLLRVLKVASTTDSFPVYAQSLHSDGEYISTYDMQTYIKFKYSLPFTGDVNVFILDNTLKLVKDLNLEQIDDKLRLSSGAFKADLNIADFSFPVHERIKTQMIEITDSLYDALKLALKYTAVQAVDKLSYVYVGDGCICGSDAVTVFMHTDKAISFDPIFINKKIYSLLNIGCKIGVENQNTVIEFPINEGYAILTVHGIEYPVDKIKLFMEKTREDTTELCNIANIRDAVDKLMPIFHGEKVSYVTFQNDEYKMVVIAESLINGKSEVEIETKCKERFTLVMDATLFKAVPFSFDVFVSKYNTFSCGERLDRLYLSDKESNEMILMGMIGV